MCLGLDYVTVFQPFIILGATALWWSRCRPEPFELEGQEVFLSKPKRSWHGDSSVLSPDTCALTTCRECKAGVLDL